MISTILHDIYLEVSSFIVPWSTSKNEYRKYNTGDRIWINNQTKKVIKIVTYDGHVWVTKCSNLIKVK